MGASILYTKPSVPESVDDTASEVAPARRSGARPGTLAKLLAERLRELVIEGELAPGSRLNERVLCDRLGASRTPLREALRVLAAEGLIELEPNRGAAVVALSRQDVQESFELMGALEALSGELACQRISDAEVNEIKALTFEMLACHARGDLPAYYRRNRAIHDRINLAAGNLLLRHTYVTHNRRIQNLRFRSNFDADKWRLAAREHAHMVEALEARDGPQLAALLKEHLKRKGEAVLAGLVELDTGSRPTTLPAPHEPTDDTPR